MTVIKGAATELGTERIRKLLVQYSVPAIIAMTASSLYNMVDSIFIGLGVGPMAISGLALTFPLMNLAAAFGSLVGVGAATLISMRLGQKDYASAQYILGNVVVLNFIIGLGFGLVTLLFLDPILYFFGASEATIGYARDYMSIILMGNVVTHMYLGLNSVLRSAGHPRKSMYATINTVVINTILDPLFIYGFGWGIRGAAIATVLAQVISLVWQFRLLSDSSELLHFHRGIYRPRKRIVKEILAIGMSPFLMNVTACFIVILINKGLKEHGGDLMIGAYGIVNRLAFFFVMIVMGLNQGMQPIAGYNFGARQYDRLMHVLKLTVIGATCVTSLGFLLGELLPPSLHQQLVDEIELLDGAAEEFDLDKVLRGELSPVFFGSALTNFGVEPFLENFLRLTSAPLARVDSLTGEPVDPCRDEFSAFIFKIQANMNKAHRDRIAFMRICSGKFERGMEAYHVQEGKNIKLATGTQLMAQDRAIVDEAYAGDIIGLFDPGIFSIGDTLCTGKKKVQFAGIPTFSPEHFARIEQKDTMKRKQFVKGMEQIAQEGAIQIFREVGGGMEEVVVGVVGVLQLEVLEYRLNTEYNVEIRMQQLPFEQLRWVQNDPDTYNLRDLDLTSDTKAVEDMKGNRLLLFTSDWAVRWAETHNESLQLSEFGNI